MAYFYNRQQDQTYTLPHAYQQNQKAEILPKYTNQQQLLSKWINHSPKENDPKIEIINKNNQNEHLTPQRNHRIFEEIPGIKVRQELNQTRNKSTPGKRHRIFEQDNSFDYTHQKIDYKYMTKNSNHNNNIKSLLLQEIEIIKQKSQLYSGSYSQLLQKLIQIVENKSDDQNLQLDPEFNNIIFKIRTLQGLDLSDKIQIEKIIKQIVNQDEKLLFQGLVKELIQNDWMYWIEPLYYDVQKQQIPKEQWKSLIEKQKQIYHV